MQYQEAQRNLTEYRKQIAELRSEMQKLQQQVQPQEVGEYRFATSSGPVALTELFGEKEYLVLIHNMGASCAHCTMWADGFNGILPHLEDAVSFVVSSPDVPADQEKFKASRHWRFRMVSHAGSSFADDMGYKHERGWRPGISVFKKDKGRVLRVSDTDFGPFDDFCSIWHIFELIPGRFEGWEPKLAYKAESAANF